MSIKTLVDVPADKVTVGILQSQTEYWRERAISAEKRCEGLHEDLVELLGKMLKQEGGA